MTATIPLASPLNVAKLVFPVYASTKWDGVPVRVDINCKQSGAEVHIRTRQGEQAVSIGALITRFAQRYAVNRWVFCLPSVITLVGEVLQRANPRAPFKDTSGIVRRQYDQSELLCIKWFDVMSPFGKLDTLTATEFLRKLDLLGIKEARATEFTKLNNEEELHTWWGTHEKVYPKSEGVIFKGSTYDAVPGKRSPQYQKGVREPTIDLRIVAYEEGKGKNAGAVGRIIADYHEHHIGIGPGKLTYKERARLWETREGIGMIATIKHKGDESYNALRQPTFQHWRHDKDTADA